MIVLFCSAWAFFRSEKSLLCTVLILKKNCLRRIQRKSRAGHWKKSG